MNFLEYNDADPWQVLQLNLLALDFPLTPQYAAQIRRTDPRAMPWLTVNAVEEGSVVGQVGVLSLPMITTEGREDVGGLWAFATHPQLAREEVAWRLLEEAHARMRLAGLRFSTLGAKRNSSAYNIARQQGYEETNGWATALAPWETAHQPTRLYAQPLVPDGYDLVEQLFLSIASDYLGFAWRHTPFAGLRQINPKDIWILRENSHYGGYAITSLDASILRVIDLVLLQSIDTAEALAAVAAKVKSAYVQVKVSRPAEMTSLQGAGFYVAQPNRDGFLVKPLVPEVTYDDARRLFGIGTDRFLISWMDVACLSVR